MEFRTSLYLDEPPDILQLDLIQVYRLPPPLAPISLKFKGFMVADGEPVAFYFYVGISNNNLFNYGFEIDNNPIDFIFVRSQQIPSLQVFLPHRLYPFFPNKELSQIIEYVNGLLGDSNSLNVRRLVGIDYTRAS